MSFKYITSTNDLVIMIQLNELLSKGGFKALSKKSKEDIKNLSKEENLMILQGWHIVRFGTMVTYWQGTKRKI